MNITDKEPSLLAERLVESYKIYYQMLARISWQGSEGGSDYLVAALLVVAEEIAKGKIDEEKGNG